MSETTDTTTAVVAEETTDQPMEVAFPEVKTEPNQLIATEAEENAIGLQEGIDDGSVQYVTMTPEEAAAAGLMPEGEEQVMTTSLQFDPANPSVLYTADGTPINKEDLSPEERALVETALQQHLAEQEAEQQLALIDSHQSELESEVLENDETKQVDEEPKEEDKKATEVENKPGEEPLQTEEENAVKQTDEKAETDDKVKETPTTASSATELMQTLVENVQKSKDAAEEKLPSPPPLAPMSTARSGGSTAGGIRYEEKIVIRQGQPHVVRVPVQSSKPKPDKTAPEVSDVLASLMPKAEIGKDGGQVIRIHQSQITEEQLNALKNNPNVRLVYRPPGGKATSTGSQTNRPKKRGRPRKNPEAPSTQRNETNSPVSPESPDEPPAKTRSGRLSKPPVYSKDYLTPKIEPTDESESFDADYKKYAYTNKQAKQAYITPGDPTPKRRGRPPLGIKKQTTSQVKPKGLTYAHKIEALRAQDVQDSNFSVQSIAYNKPALTPIEQAISTRRKNRLTELLGACSSDEIMEVALPHLARGFSLWEFLVTKVEKNKKSRVHFADVYKEYESLHKYISKLADKYKEVLKEKKFAEAVAMPDNEIQEEKMETAEDKQVENVDKDELKTSTGEENGSKESEIADETEEKKITKIKIKCKALAASLGLRFEELENAEIALIDPQDALGPYIMGTSGQRYSQMNKSTYQLQDKSARNKNAVTSSTFTTKSINEGIRLNSQFPVKIQSTPSMPPLKPLGVGAMSKQKQAETALLASVVNDTNVNTVTGTVETQSISKPETLQPNVEATTGAETLMLNQDTTIITAPEGTGPQLIQIGQGDDQQLIEVPEGYSLIQTPEGLVMSQPGTTLTQGDDGAIYITYADGTTTPLSAAQQQSVQMETVESLLSLDGTTQ